MSYAASLTRIYSQKHFQTKIGRTVRNFSLGQKNHIIIQDKECIARLIPHMLLKQMEQVFQ